MLGACGVDAALVLPPCFHASTMAIPPLPRLPSLRYRESKLTMMLAKGLGGNNMLHIILALSNSREQVNEGTACLRFGQSCLSMTVNPNANKLEKEQAEMKAVIKEQMQEIVSLQEENEVLKRQLEEEKNRATTEVPDFLIAKHIEVNKEALRDDLKEATEQIDELRAALAERKREQQELVESGAGADLEVDESEFEHLCGVERSTAIEAKRRELILDRMRKQAENEQEQRSVEGEIAQLLEIQTKLEEKLKAADSNKSVEEERIRAEVEEQAAEKRREIEDRAAAMEAALKTAQAEADARDAERKRREAELEEELRAREEKLRQEDDLRKQMENSTAEQHQELQQQMAALQHQRAAQEAEIEATRAEQARLEALQNEANAAIEAKKAQEAELEAMRSQIAQMAREQEERALSEGQAKVRRGLEGDTSMYDPSGTMISKAEVRLERHAKRGRRADPVGVARIFETLPVLSACNDLRALTDLEAANRTLFQEMGGIKAMVDYLKPRGQNAPYATIVARTLPCVLDAHGRRMFHEYSMAPDAEGEARYNYLLWLLQSSDPDDKENACLAIAAAAQESEINRQAFFEHGLSAQVRAPLNGVAKSLLVTHRAAAVS